MNIAYTNNPERPRVRIEAVRFVRRDWSTRKVARHMGFDHSSIVRWMGRALGKRKVHSIPTLSLKPHHHTHEIPKEIVWKILELRRERSQCAEIIHHRLREEGTTASLSSVKRVLRRHRVSRFSPWKRRYRYPSGPMSEKPGFLVEIDTIHGGELREGLVLYTLFDVRSRWAFASPTVG